MFCAFFFRKKRRHGTATPPWAACRVHEEVVAALFFGFPALIQASCAWVAGSLPWSGPCFGRGQLQRCKFLAPEPCTKRLPGEKSLHEGRKISFIHQQAFHLGPFPVMMALMSLSLFKASTGVRLLMSMWSISSRIWLKTGSSSWKNDS